MAIATKHYCKDTSVHTCASGTYDWDFSTVQGSGYTADLCTKVDSATWVDIGRVVVDAATFDGAAQDYAYSIYFATIPSGYEVRFRLEELDGVCCETADDTGWSATYTTTGIKTGTFSSYAPGYGAGYRVALQFQAQRVTGHANAAIQIYANDADCWVEMPVEMPEAVVNDSIAISDRVNVCVFTHKVALIDLGSTAGAQHGSEFNANNTGGEDCCGSGNAIDVIDYRDGTDTGWNYYLEPWQGTGVCGGGSGNMEEGLGAEDDHGGPPTYPNIEFPNTDIYKYFGKHLNASQLTYIETNVSSSGIRHVLSGLDPTKQYDITIAAIRGDISYSRASDYHLELSSVVGYQNQHSSSSLIPTGGYENASSTCFNAGDNWGTAEGLVARWINVQPESGGGIIFRHIGVGVTAPPLPVDKSYISGFWIVEHAPRVLYVNVSDSIEVADWVDYEMAGGPLNVENVFSAVEISDYVQARLDKLHPTVSDSVDIAEFVKVLLTELHAGVSDSVEISDYVNAQLDKLFPSVSDSVEIAEYVKAKLASKVVVSDSAIAAIDYPKDAAGGHTPSTQYTSSFTVDGNGWFWVFWIDPGAGARNVQYGYSTDRGLTWTTGNFSAFNSSPAQPTQIDKVYVLKFNDGTASLGLIIGDESDSIMEFHHRHDSEDVDADWETKETMETQTDYVDDHIDALAYETEVYVVCKTGLDTVGQPTTVLYKRVPAPSWSRTTVWNQVSGRGFARPRMAIDDTDDEIYVFASQHNGSYGEQKIAFQKSSIASLSFSPDSAGEMLIDFYTQDSVEIDDPSTCKEFLHTHTTGMPVLAGDPRSTAGDRYYYWGDALNPTRDGMGFQGPPISSATNTPYSAGGAGTRPTNKCRHVMWYYDNFWWAMLFVPDALGSGDGAWHIFRLMGWEWIDQSVLTYGQPGDGRDSARPDVVLEGDTLYVHWVHGTQARIEIYQYSSVHNVWTKTGDTVFVQRQPPEPLALTHIYVRDYVSVAIAILGLLEATAESNIEVSDFVQLVLDKLFPQVSDVVEIAEFVKVVLTTLNATAVSNVEISDYVQAKLDSLHASCSDIIEITDWVKVALTHAASTYSVVEIADWVKLVLDQLRPAVNDAIEITDSVNVVLTELLTSVSSNIEVAEYVRVLIALHGTAVQDSVAVTDWVAATLDSLHPVVADDVTITDWVNAALTHTTSVYSEIEITEFVRAVLDKLHVVVSDSIEISEWVAAEIAGATLLSVNVFSNIQVTDQVNSGLDKLFVSVSDAVAVEDNVEGLLDTLHVNTFDLIEVGDSVNTALVHAVNVFDNIVVSDSVSALLDKLYVSVVDSIAVSDYVRRVVSTLMLSVFDNIAVSDSVHPVVTPLNVNVQDNITVVDDVQGSLIIALGLAITDNITVTDAVMVVVFTPEAVLRDVFIMQGPVDKDVLIRKVKNDQTLHIRKTKQIEVQR